MTQDETIEQQARREAEAKYPMPVFDSHCYVYTTDTSMAYASVAARREGYAARIIAERSKLQPSDHIHTVHEAVGGGYVCSGCDMRFSAL